jgi:hypothetical protein
MHPEDRPDFEFEDAKKLLTSLEAKPTQCMLCQRILFEDKLRGDVLGPLEIRNILLSPQQQADHLERCLKRVLPPEA